MTSSASVPHAASRLDFLVQRLDAFERFHIGDHRLQISGFIDLVERDDILCQVWRALEHHLPGPAQGWFEAALAQGSLPPLPADPIAATALRYALVRRIRQEKVDLRHLVANVCPGEHLNGKLMHWKRLVVHPLAHDLRLLCGLVKKELAGEWADVEALARAALEGPFGKEAFGPRAWNDEDDAKAEADEETKRKAERAAREAPRPAPPPPPGFSNTEETTPMSPVSIVPDAVTPATGTPRPNDRTEDRVEAALSRLESAIAAIGHPGLRGELLLDARALRLESWRPTRRAERAIARVRSLARHPELAGPCQDLIAALS